MKMHIQLPVRCFILLLGLLLSAGAFAQDISMFVKIKAARQGDIKGDVMEKGREGSIEVLSYSHEIISPRDPASGQATGRRQHKPFVITKAIDKASPLLHSALSDNENLPEVTLSFYRPSRKSTGEGTIAQYFTIKLQNATIAGISTKLGEKGRPVEEISFVYQRISWTYTDGNVTSQDNWFDRN